MIRIIISIIAHVSGLSSPDGLAVGGNCLWAAIEGDGSVIRIDPGGSYELVAEGLRSPEGLWVTTEGNLLVTEDRSGGRLLRITADGMELLADGLDCPEGVCQDPEGVIWFTTGGIEAGSLLTSLWMIHGGEALRVFSLPSMFSLSDIEAGRDGRLFLCCEAAGTAGNVSVLVHDPLAGTTVPFVTGVPACEGICFTEGGFPMYLVSEEGAVHVVDSAGTAEVFIQGIGPAEDAAVWGDSLFVSRDGSGTITGYLIHE